MNSSSSLPSDTNTAAEKLRKALKAVTENNQSPSREAILSVFRRHLGRFQTFVREEFEQNKLSGVKAARQLANFTDGLITVLFEYVYQDLLNSKKKTDYLALVATGGYGRRILAPFSDIDLLFLTSEKPSPVLLKAIEYNLYFLWDLGLKVGHATRSVSECLKAAKEDLTILTALLDARFIVGSEPLFDNFESSFKKTCQEITAYRFIMAKFKERSARHKRFGETPYMVEPNIKEGRGGLRDLQTLYWEYRFALGVKHFADFAQPTIAAFNFLTDQEIHRIRRVRNFLWSVRFHLHYITARSEDRLTFDMQPVVGGRMGYTKHGRQVGVERFMRHYFLMAREVLRLTYVMESVLTRYVQHPHITYSDYEYDKTLDEAGFTILEDQILPTPQTSFDQEPIAMMRLLSLAKSEKRRIHPLALHEMIRWERRAATLRDNQEAADIFLDLLCDIPNPLSQRNRHKLLNKTKEKNHNISLQPPEDEQYNTTWLHTLNETGILGQFMPEWRRMVGQMQFDTYHVYTVDEHSIEAVRLLALLDAGYYQEDLQFAYDLLQGVQSRRALYMATLLHDMGKGHGADHSELGSQMALEICSRLGMSAEETDTISWLILHHLLLSHTAFQRDIDDPKTILDLVDTIQSPERLRLLFLLTISDMRAVNPKVWNAWKATLLSELYTRVAEVLEGSLATAERDTRVIQTKANITKQLQNCDLVTSEIEYFLGLGYASYWLSFDEETHIRHARLITLANNDQSPITIATHPLPVRGVTEITVYAADHAGLFSKIAGALAISGASIVDARIHTLTNAMALDTFWVQDASEEAFDEPHRLNRMSNLIEQALTNNDFLDKRIQECSKHVLYGRRMRAIHVPPRVVIDNHASNSFTVIEVNGRDRLGLLYDVTKAIKEQKLQISSAHITTYGIRAVDVFYVKDAFGLKIQDKNRLNKIREAILEVLQKAEESLTGNSIKTIMNG